MTFNAHDASEFSRMAAAAYRDGQNEIGHMVSGINAGCVVSLEKFDELKSIYRAWLVFNEWPAKAAG